MSACALRAAAGLALVLLMLAPGPARADAGGSSTRPTPPALAEARDLLAEGSYGEAVPHLQAFLREHPDHADAHNLLGFSLRKVSRYEEALRHYGRALQLNPRHRGAHGYIGEAYLALGQPERAREHLARLDEICWLGCREFNALRDAIAAYEAGRR